MCDVMRCPGQRRLLATPGSQPSPHTLRLQAAGQPGAVMQRARLLSHSCGAIQLDVPGLEAGATHPGVLRLQ
ncbi:hypothetical protein HaLaN_02706 [Haematococcus lacustris]|uniref:Uncharacterized protein n=1 Tax=Haematococcus lacustris TaxID=44745 RepID=A0A699YES3_HAELA|nr:hypothetical protein HaLaN_02706 [Haematococcus lacustris]